MRRPDVGRRPYRQKIQCMYALFRSRFTLPRHTPMTIADQHRPIPKGSDASIIICLPRGLSGLAFNSSCIARTIITTPNSPQTVARRRFTFTQAGADVLFERKRFIRAFGSIWREGSVLFTPSGGGSVGGAVEDLKAEVGHACLGIRADSADGHLASIKRGVLYVDQHLSLNF
jgi:hypothetical protein